MGSCPLECGEGSCKEVLVDREGRTSLVGDTRWKQLADVTERVHLDIERQNCVINFAHGADALRFVSCCDNK